MLVVVVVVGQTGTDQVTPAVVDSGGRDDEGAIGEAKSRQTALPSGAMKDALARRRDERDWGRKDLLLPPSVPSTTGSAYT